MHRIGVLGASFNPPTLGHHNVIQQALTAFDEILLIPSAAHAFHKNVAPLDQRMAMLEIFIQDWQDSPSVTIFNIEPSMQLKYPEKKLIYTFDVLCELEAYYQAQNKTVTLGFITGPDNIKPQVWQKFYRYQEIEKRWPLFIAQDLTNIRSTTVRAVVAQWSGDPVELKNRLSAMVPVKIADYIIAQHLYFDLHQEKGSI